MPKNSAVNRKEIAWNSVCFKVPDKWEIGQIGMRHLILEDDRGPAMEIKWGPVKGRFSHRAHLKKLNALQTGRLRKTIQKWKLPSEWEKALADFQVSGFTWRADASNGRGVILYCPTCRHAALIQFFRTQSTAAQTICPEVLKSFEDHREDDQTAWSVFDIHAMLPANLKLVHYRFKPGNYELAFEHRDQKVFLYRWAPASVLLAAGDLREFGKALSDFTSEAPVPVMVGGVQVLEWRGMPGKTWFSRFKRQSAFNCLRLWHLEEKNRILGVKVQAKRAVDICGLNRICASYGSL